jgi:copper chaperone
METKTFVVPNISCEHCVHTIENEISEIQGVKVVKAEETSKQVTIQWEAPATWPQIESTLEVINYPPAK